MLRQNNKPGAKDRVRLDGLALSRPGIRRYPRYAKFSYHVLSRIFGSLTIWHTHVLHTFWASTSVDHENIHAVLLPICSSSVTFMLGSPQMALQTNALQSNNQRTTVSPAGLHRSRARSAPSISINQSLPSSPVEVFGKLVERIEGISYPGRGFDRWCYLRQSRHVGLSVSRQTERRGRVLCQNLWLHSKGLHVFHYWGDRYSSLV